MDAGSTPASSTIKQKTTTPDRGFLFFRCRCKLACKRQMKNKKNHAQHGGCFLFAGLELRDGERSEHPRHSEIGCFLFTGLELRDGERSLHPRRKFTTRTELAKPQKPALRMCRCQRFVVFLQLNLPVIFWVKIYHPFNTIFVSKHSKIRTPGTVRNRHFNLSAC